MKQNFVVKIKGCIFAVRSEKNGIKFFKLRVTPTSSTTGNQFVTIKIAAKNNQKKDEIKVGSKEKLLPLHSHPNGAFRKE
ncbi:hypothetical protein MKQ70_33095 [Chitinophaga sedimenti]|uniref:hypothetical protein n=1 Tax=Chitinophaga sedimenti TaxID=2033606 RepID=UPI0020064E85|nr:hypothetical protein [Chitinophaga sedimenti]MCK7559541.1 hypothetical protein [Chitinophaga sedimenti]